jgi:hypothetical protein
MTRELAISFDSWCRYSLDIVRLDDLHLREAMHYRNDLKQTLADGTDLTEDEQAAVAAADAAFAREAAYVMPRLTHGGWLERQPADHYAHDYAARHPEA